MTQMRIKHEQSEAPAMCIIQQIPHLQSLYEPLLLVVTPADAEKTSALRKLCKAA